MHDPMTTSPITPYQAEAQKLIRTPHVYVAINAVLADLGREGISKDRKNAQQGYQFRGIDDVYAALNPALARHELCILPRVMGRTVTEQQSKSGGTLFYVVLDVEFDLVSAADGSKHTVRAAGEAMDSGDKATNKAMSAAYKYMAMQTFCIPTEGDNDADATTHQVVRSMADRSGRPDTAAVAQDTVRKWTKAFRDALADRNDERVCKGLDDLNADQETYTAVWDALEPKERGNILDAANRARTARAAVRKAF